MSGGAVETDQLAQLHSIGLSQPLRPGQGPGGAEVEWWKLGSMVLGRACRSSIECAPRAFQFVLFDGKHGIFDVFGRMTTFELRTHQLPLNPLQNLMSVSITPRLIKFRHYLFSNHLNEKSPQFHIKCSRKRDHVMQDSENQIEAPSGLNWRCLPGKVKSPFVASCPRSKVVQFDVQLPSQ